MKPVTVSTQVSKPSGEVFDYLEAIANHEQFLGKIFDEWEFSGPQRGVGHGAREAGVAEGAAIRTHRPLRPRLRAPRLRRGDPPARQAARAELSQSAHRAVGRV
jgi:hypothetical protein